MEEFPFNIMWNLWVLMKISFFAWEASWGRILTLDQLKRRVQRLWSRCYLCKGKEEIVNHIVLHFSKVVMPQQLIYTLFDDQLVMLSLVRDVRLSWHRSFAKKKRKKAQRVAPLCLFQTTWKKRNRRTSKNMDMWIKKLNYHLYIIFWNQFQCTQEIAPCQ